MRDNPYKDLPPLERRPDGSLYRMTPAQRKHTRRKLIRWLLILLCAVIVMAFAALVILNSPYGTKQFLQYCTYLL